MANQRLINCDFFIKGAFDNKISNNAKLLYFSLVINADDMGFVGNADKIIKDLNENLETSALFQYNFDNASDELVERGLVYRFYDKHQNQTLLIRHWFVHNKYQDFLTTNFVSFLAQVELVGNCYEMKNPYKGKEIKQINKTNKTNKLSNDISSSHKEDNEDSKDNAWEEQWDKTLEEIEKL